MPFASLSSILLCLAISIAYPVGILSCSYFICGGRVFTDRNHPSVVSTRNVFVGNIGIIILFTVPLKFTTNSWMHDLVLPSILWMTLLTPVAVWNSIDRLNKSNTFLSNALLVISSIGIFSNNLDRCYLRSFFIGPIVEELLFRGALFHLLSNYSPLNRVYITAACFSISHTHPLFYGHDKRFTLAQCLVTFIFGLFAGLAYEHSGRLVLTPVIMHILGNSVGCG